VLETFAGRLIKIGVLSRRDIPSLTKYQIILARDQYRKNPSSQNVGIHQGIIEGDFALCISLYHGYELLLQMGVRSLFIYLYGIMDGSKVLTRTKNELARNEDFMKLYQKLRDMFSDTSLASVNGNVYKSKTVFENKKEFIYSHPKLRKLEEIVIEHFKSWKKGHSGTSVDAVDTRVMIFSSFRDSVQEIAEMLSRLSPVVRVMTFVGHSTGKNTKGFTQKEQLEVVKRFREGGYNTLVSTCVGEEGLDIGEVDLIICFDAQKSPIRLVQRMGRTGRRRQGRIVVILAEGREERTYNQSQSNKRSIHKAISGNKMLHFYQHSPRMIPEGINPKLHKMFITAEKYEPSNSRTLSKERRSGSLQHRSALFSCVTDRKKENWSLSPEEFEIWDRLYRIKESDGVKEPVLPQIHFETLENLEDTSKHEEEATHKLSLSEWRIWQNRPFPTFMVEHSDRCYNFISVMEMIELLRHEQGDCSYELEIQPHLRIEDVNVQRNKSHLSMTNSAFDQKAHSSRKDVAHRKNVIIEEEKSIHLFEDEHIYDTNNGSFSMKNKCLVRSDPGESGLGAVAERGSEWFHSEVCGVNAEKTCKEQAVSRKTPAMEMPGGAGVTELFLDDEGLYDSSQELFSVNFDLGFSIEEYENEICEEDTNTNNTKKLNGAWGRHADVKSTEDKKKLLDDSSRLETTPKRGWKSFGRRDVSTPVPLRSRSMNDGEGTEDGTAAALCLKAGGKRTGSGSPEALASSLSTPPSRKAMNSKPIKRIPINAFSSTREEVPEVRLTDKENKNKSPHGQSCGGSAMDALDSPVGRTGNLGDSSLRRSCVSPAQGISSESEEEIVFQRKNRKKKNVLKSPDVTNDSDFESPIRAIRKRRQPFNMSDTSSDDSMDFHKHSSRTSAACDKNQPRSTKRQKVKNNLTYKTAARQFLDEEAELSQQDADGVSSDESDDAENELSSSLAQFLNDDAEVTQVLNDCEMKGVYLKSVRSPALGNRYKMVHREFNNMAIFSQIPEQDQTYAEDSFCVGEEEEETCKISESSEEEVCVNFDLLNNESFTSGRKQYLTRRRKKLNQVGMEENCSVPVQKKKPSRIIVLSDSSGEETGVGNEKPMQTECFWAEQENAKLPKSLPSVSSVQHKKTAGEIGVHQSAESKSEMLLGLKASVSEMLDFHPEPQARSTHIPLASRREDLQVPTEVESSLKNTCRSTSVPHCSASTNPSSATALFSCGPLEKKPPLCILVDSREISSGAEVISSLKAVHGVKVQVCSLSSSDYIVSNRMAVERKFLSELLNSVNRSKVTRRIQRLQSMFERICVIVEKDRVKAGETSRFFQRTQYYDGVLSALVQAGVRILFSSCQEETAGLLKDLALVEQRKNAAICVPTEVEGHKREMLNFFLTIPNLSYLAALNMCHYFGSVKKMANSSALDIATGAQVSRQKAEEIFRYLHYGFDTQMLPENLCAKGRSNAMS
ncbi:PREDICTED: Fanconi anemia group M protein, partial [Pterocles gutturalis]|uniref:Fanconi anemia group M protein n=1 Tax=Pterocles gutturalis TaxID=240206 RepID=UPI000528A290